MERPKMPGAAPHQRRRISTPASNPAEELRVRFQPLQRALLLEELHLTRDVLQETIARGESTIHCESDRIGVRAAKRRNFETVSRLMTVSHSKSRQRRRSYKRSPREELSA
jgi:hypothetical protein